MDVLSDAIESMRVGSPSASRARVGAGGWRFPPYEGAGFHVVLEGACWLVPDEGRPVALGVGDVALLPYGHGHALVVGGGDPPTAADAGRLEEWRIEAARRPADGGPGADVLCGKYRSGRWGRHPLLRELPPTVHVRSRIGGHPDLRAAIELLAHETGPSRPGSDAVVMGLLDVLLVYLVRAWLRDQPAPDAGWRRALGDPVCAAALQAMHRDPARPWTMETLSRDAGVSRSTLARRFTALVGRPPMAYLTWWRMTRAARLLRESDMPTARVAADAGYTSPFAFSHAFKREFGMAPGRYRHEHGRRSALDTARYPAP